MTEFEISGKQYRVGKLDAFKQFHVSRRIAPIIPTLVPVFLKISKDGSVTKDLAGIAELLVPFADGIAAMSDVDSEYVIGTCLSAVQRQSMTNWTPVWSQSARAAMFEDMDLGVIMQIVLRVIQDSLGPFIQGLLTSQMSSPAA